MTPAESTLVIHKIARQFDVPAWSADKIEAWAEQLEDLDRDRTATVVLTLLRTVDECPSIGAIRRAVADGWARDTGHGWLPVDEAWAEVDRRIIPLGHTSPFTATRRNIPAPSPFVAQVVERLGWSAICQSENLDVIRGQFRAFYAAALERAMLQAAANPGAMPPARIAPDQARIEAPAEARRALGSEAPVRLTVVDGGRALFSRMADRLADKGVHLGADRMPIEREAIPATVPDAELHQREERKRHLAAQAAALRGQP